MNSVDIILTYSCTITCFRHLDLSGSEDVPQTHNHPGDCLSYIADNLPNLTSLDISVTNLASYGTQASNRFVNLFFKRAEWSCLFLGYKLPLLNEELFINI